MAGITGLHYQMQRENHKGETEQVCCIQHLPAQSNPDLIDASRQRRRKRKYSHDIIAQAICAEKKKKKKA